MALPRMNNWSVLDPAVRLQPVAADRCSCPAAAPRRLDALPPLSCRGSNVAFVIFAIHMMASARSWARST